MKSILTLLLILTALNVRAASTDTVKASTDTAEGTIDSIAKDMTELNKTITFLTREVEETPEVKYVPVEQKVIELHMATTISVEDEKTKKKNRIETLPFRAGTCSGSFIDDSGDILTAKHCVTGFDTFEIQTYDRRIYTGVVVATSAIHDLALIHIDLRDTPYFTLAKTVTRGEPIRILGSPLSITDTLSVGVIARIDGDATLVDCSALPGNSGGPVFDADENLIGVLTSGYIVGFGVTHLNRAQGLDAVHFFLKETLEKRHGHQ